MIVPFEPWHLTALNIQGRQKALFDWYCEKLGGPEQYGEAFLVAAIQDENGYCAWTAMVDGVVVGCSGVFAESLYTGEAWALLSEGFTKANLCVKMKIIKAIKDVILRIKVQRLQANTEVEFEEGRRFLEYLGFEQEGVMKYHTPFGGDSVLYGMKGSGYER
jgi:hypothetical protein